MLINPYIFLKNLELLFSLRRLNNEINKAITIVDPNSQLNVDIDFDGNNDLDFSSYPNDYIVSNATLEVVFFLLMVQNFM